MLVTPTNRMLSTISERSTSTMATRASTESGSARPIRSTAAERNSVTETAQESGSTPGRTRWTRRPAARPVAAANAGVRNESQSTSRSPTLIDPLASATHSSAATKSPLSASTSTPSSGAPNRTT